MSWQPAGFTPYELDTYEGAYHDLPSVDDLEVAAAAAAAAMEAVDMTSSPAESDEEVCSTACCFAYTLGFKRRMTFMLCMNIHLHGRLAVAWQTPKH